MRRLEAIYSSVPSFVPNDVRTWSDENPKVNIITANGICRGSDGDTITYIVYEDDPGGLNLLNS